MDKKVNINANTDTSKVHQLPKGMRQIHQRYGLWICKFSRNQSAPPSRPDDLPFRHFEFYDLSHMFDGKGWYCAAGDGVIRDVGKGDGILVSPGFKHKYGGDAAPYVEDAISFLGPLADFLRDSGVMRDGVMRIGNARRLLPIIELAGDNSNDAQIKANFELQKLLVELYFENKSQGNPPSDRVIEALVAEIRKHPQRNWAIDEMAEFCNMSPSQFKRLFKGMTGMTAKGYIDQFKTQLAVEMLASRAKSINEIAAEVGYADPYHFSRRFKQLTGYAPATYRRLFCR